MQHISSGSPEVLWLGEAPFEVFLSCAQTWASLNKFLGMF